MASIPHEPPGSLLNSARPSTSACDNRRLKSSKQADQTWLKNVIEAMIDGASTGAAAVSPALNISVAVCTEQEDESYIVHPAEAQGLSPNSRQRKRREFALGRIAAKTALREIGIETIPPIMRGAEGEPLWPQGVRGSITHCFPWTVAAVARCVSSFAIGIDLEDVRRLHDLATLDLICSTAERDWVSAGDSRARLIMVFSAKEAVYKALYPFCRRYIDFKEVELRWRAEDECFDCKFLIEPMAGWALHQVHKVYCRRYKEMVVSLAMWDFREYPLPLQQSQIHHSR